jgi:hypothetical protein
MEFTGQAAIDFKKWFLDVKCKDVKRKIPKKLKYLVFLSRDPAEQFGVRQDWLDSVGVVVDVHPILGYDEEKYTNVIRFSSFAVKLNKVYEWEPTESKTRPEARLAVVKKADELYNAQTSSTI